MAVVPQLLPEGDRPGRRAEGAAAGSTALDAVLAEFTDRWECGEAPAAEDFLGRLPSVRPADAVELIYREFCLAEGAGLDPDPADYLARFPSHAPALARLFDVHEALGPTRLPPWDEAAAPPDPPEVGDAIGPYLLIRELGEGAFARVFLAEQSDLDDRLVVVKVSTRVTPEPRLLARARHPNIVEVLWAGEVEGGALQVICMPFLGGATLASVLAGRRARGGRRPASGRDLLVELDRASAQGYPVPATGQPAREVLAGLSYTKAAAWLVARLAEALDHAFSRGVLHGDVKPSNVLLTADGNPMLIDFNLSVGWARFAPPGPGRGRGRGDRPEDAGGTLAYMAPERLRAIADPSQAPRASATDRHRADIYALGVVLLELLTGRPPEPPGGTDRPRPIRELASAYVSARSAGGGAGAGLPRGPVPAGLRAVLRRCLAPDPAERYARAAELAEDLDRWRSNRSLAFAEEPPLSSGLTRWARRQWPALTVAAFGLVVAFAATATAWHSAAVARRARADQAYSQIDNDPATLLNRRPGFGVLTPWTNPAERARRHLERYGVLGDGDWRARDEFVGLDPARRAELEVFLLEQALRFAHALDVPGAGREDLRRALFCLGRATPAPFGPLREEARRLRGRLGITDPSAPSALASRAAPAAAPGPPGWMNEYLLGVAAELRGTPADALGHYEAVLRERPGSFWASYRAASVQFARAARSFAEERDTPHTQALYGAAADRLRTCVDQQPENVTLRRQLASCLYYQHRFAEAGVQCDKAVSLAPEHAETYLTRALLRVKLRQIDGYLSDLARYDALAGRRAPAGSPLRLAGIGIPAAGPEPPAAPGTGPDEAFLQRILGEALWEASRSGLSGPHQDTRLKELALEAFDRAVAANPDDLPARYARGRLLKELRRGDPDEDFGRVADLALRAEVGHPSVSFMTALQRGVRFKINRGQHRAAIDAAAGAVKLARRSHVMEVESAYLLATAYASAARADPGQLPLALRQLKRTYRDAPDEDKRAVISWYQYDDMFAEIREGFGLSPLYETH